MRVICTTTETYVTGDNYGGTSCRRGSIYNVVNITTAEVILEKHWRIREAGGVPARGNWYELLELSGYHHESKFLELPDDNDIVEEQIELESDKYLK